MQMPLSHKFVAALDSELAGVSPQHELKNIVVVGADTGTLHRSYLDMFDPDSIPDDYDPEENQYLYCSEEAYLLAANRRLLSQKFSVAARPEIMLCDLNFGSDLLKDKPECDFLVLSSLMYSPKSLDSSIGTATL